MISHQFSKHFDPATDAEFKHSEFKKTIAEYMAGFLDCYPHLIKRKIENGVEVFIFKFSVDDK